MKIVNLRVENYRGVRNAEVKSAKSAVVIAGPNGSGKSCMLDAIRLLKSAYGSYHQDEIDLYVNEFQLQSEGRNRDFRGGNQGPKPTSNDCSKDRNKRAREGVYAG